MADETIKTLAEVEENHIRAVFERVEGNMTRCAEALGIDRRTMYRKARAFGLKSRMPQGRPPWRRVEVLEARVAELETELIALGGPQLR